MNKHAVSLFVAAAVAILARAAVHEGSMVTATPEAVPVAQLAPGDCSLIQAGIDALPPGGGEVALPPGTYTCTRPIVIDRNDVTLRGAGAATTLRLADGANAPVLVIGGMAAVPAASRSGIRVSDLRIDGNRRNQQQECMSGPCSAANPLRNNGITLRRVSDVVVERVSILGARSGGLVSELGCARLRVTDVTVSDSHFDGLAGYETVDSILSRLELVDNRASGLSFDIRFNGNIVSDAVIAGSGTVGVFMRDSRDNVFHGLQVTRSAEHGVFLAQVDADTSTPAAGNVFSAVGIFDSGGAGFRVNDASNTGNLLAAAQLAGSRGGCISEAAPGLLQRSGVVCR